MRSSLVVAAALLLLPRCAFATIDSISVSPPSPTPGASVTVTADGHFSDFCWQVNDIRCGTQPGNLITIDVDVVYYDYGSCPPMRVPYNTSCPQGNLPAGTYLVRVAEHYDICDMYGCTSYPYAEVKWDTIEVADPLAVADVAGSRAPALESATPNPFFARTSVSYIVPQHAAGSVVLDVLDLSGRRVRHLLDAPASAGRHRLDWDGRRDDGSAAPAGLYYFAGSIAGHPVRARVTRIR
jgi:FlgD Ig-like domain